jgi:hypothetical protein
LSVQTPLDEAESTVSKKKFWMIFPFIVFFLLISVTIFIAYNFVS